MKHTHSTHAKDLIFWTLVLLCSFLAFSSTGFAQRQPPTPRDPNTVDCVQFVCSTSSSLTWSSTQADEHSITAKQFRLIPAGYRVHVLRIKGSHTAYVKGSAMPSSSSAVLFSFERSQSNLYEGRYLDTSSTKSFAFEIGATTINQPLNRSFDIDTTAGGLLGVDNVLETKLAAFDNDTAATIKQHLSYVVEFMYVPAQD
jgi:hypothetical protein